MFKLGMVVNTLVQHSGDRAGRSGLNSEFQDSHDYVERPYLKKKKKKKTESKQTKHLENYTRLWIWSNATYVNMVPKITWESTCLHMR